MQTTINNDTDLLANILGGDDIQCQSTRPHECSGTVTHRVWCIGGCQTSGLVCTVAAVSAQKRIDRNSHRCIHCSVLGIRSLSGECWKVIKI